MDLTYSNADSRSTIAAPPVVSDLTRYLSKATENYVVCLDCLGDEPARDNLKATARFHHLKLHRVSGEPMFTELAGMLADQLVEYCFSVKRRRGARTPHDIHKLHREARDLLRRYKTGGEAGELLIYFLIEAILGAPQIVAKMELKTNPRLESFGADGVHIKWNDQQQSLDVYCAESKLEDNPSGAIANVVKSLTAFHKNRDYTHELRLATAHFKYSEKKIQDAVVRILENKDPDHPWKLRHACLVGYDWHGYSNLAGDLSARENEFKTRYRNDRGRLHELVRTHFGKLNLPLLEFEIFFLPFRTVQEFRDAFDRAV